MRIGVFGGSFDPVHKGHEALVYEMKKALSLDKVLLIPVYVSPFKQDRPPQASPQERLFLLNLVFENVPWVEVLPLEIERKGVSYTIDTIRLLKKEYPREELFLLLSEDAIENFSSWKEVENLKKLVTAVFAGEKKGSCPHGQIVAVKKIPICSTKIRNEGCRETSLYLDPKAMDYIQKHDLYSYTKYEKSSRRNK